MSYHIWEPPWAEVSSSTENQFKFRDDVGNERMKAFGERVRPHAPLDGDPIDPELFTSVRNAVPTDVLTDLVFPKALCVSSRMKRVLERHDILDHRFHPTRIARPDGDPLDYWIFHWSGSIVPHIDFNRSTFVQTEILNRARPIPVEIGSAIEYEELRLRLLKDAQNHLWIIRASRATLVSGSFRGRDLMDPGLLIVTIPWGFIVSDRLLGALLNEGVTGVQFRPAMNLIAHDQA
jgi:hypothetical protein